MPNTRHIDGTTMIACIAFVLMMMRSISVCTAVFLSFNLSVYRTAAIQVHATSSTSTGATRTRNIRPRSSKRNDEQTLPEPRNTSQLLSTDAPSQDFHQHHLPARLNPRLSQGAPHSNKTTQGSPNSCSPPPYSFNAPHSDSNHLGSASIIELYENIMASDAQTIQVQQQTMSSQQEIIRSQAQMISKLRHVLEEQDRMIEELDDARGLRSRRPGLESAPRSRSS